MGVSHRVTHPHKAQTFYASCLLFSNVSSMEKLLSPQTSVNFPSLQKKKKEIQHSQNKENFWIFKSGITSLTVYLVYSLKKDLWHRRKPNNSSICILYSQIFQINNSFGLNEKPFPCRTELNHLSWHIVMFKSAPDLCLHQNLSITTTFNSL